MPSDDVSVVQIGQRHWQGPEVFLIIDDSERLPAGYDSPLVPIAPFVQAGADVGLHIVYTRLFGAFMAGLGADPVLRLLRDATEPLLVMDSDPDPGFVKGSWKGHSMPRRPRILDEYRYIGRIRNLCASSRCRVGLNSLDGPRISPCAPIHFFIQTGSK